MNAIKFIIVLAISLFITSLAFSQQENGKSKNKKNKVVIVIKTSAQCEMCKERLEKAMAYEKGVSKSDLNLENKEFTITYNPAKTNPEKIKKAITMVGYDADEFSANKEAYEQLPGCCKKPDDPNHQNH